jgi:hypothetical protein
MHAFVNNKLIGQGGTTMMEHWLGQNHDDGALPWLPGTAAPWLAGTAGGPG